MISDPIILSLSNQFGITLQTQEDFENKLASVIDDLIANDFARLVQILYRLDISEKRLKELLAAQQGRDASIVIARLIIEREKQKIESRKNFRQHDDIPDNEKW